MTRKGERKPISTYEPDRPGECTVQIRYVNKEDWWSFQDRCKRQGFVAAEVLRVLIKEYASGKIALERGE